MNVAVQLDERRRQLRDVGHYEVMRAHLNLAVDAADKMAEGQRVLGEALCAALDTVAGGAPRVDMSVALESDGNGSPRASYFDCWRADALWWAESAPPVMVELHVAAGLAVVPRRPFAPRTKRRVMAAIWQSMTADERAAFLASVTKGAAS